MKLSYLPIPFLCLAMLSCDKARNMANKAKNVADQARSAVEAEIAKQGGKSGDVQPDPELQKLVDQTPEGVIFRKDLAFPSKVEVNTTRNEEFSGRRLQKSELGTEVGVLKGTFTTVSRLERAGDKVTYTLVQSIFTEPAAEGADDSEKPVVRELSPPSNPTAFVKSGSSWKLAVNSDFRTASLAQSIIPVFDQLLVEGTVSPRALWFAKKRLKIGDEITVSEKSLPMIVTGDAKGSLKLKLESLEAVKGHPCGVFSITGSFSRNQFPDFDGSLTDEDVTISSGRIWLSLIHPIILKEETEVIQTTRKGGQGGLTTRIQSSSKVSVIREWKHL